MSDFGGLCSCGNEYRSSRQKFRMLSVHLFRAISLYILLYLDDIRILGNLMSECQRTQNIK